MAEKVVVVHFGNIQHGMIVCQRFDHQSKIDAERLVALVGKSPSMREAVPRPITRYSAVHAHLHLLENTPVHDCVIEKLIRMPE